MEACGIDAWFDSADANCSALRRRLPKVSDTTDVWFESALRTSVPEQRANHQARRL